MSSLLCLDGCAKIGQTDLPEKGFISERRLLVLERVELGVGGAEVGISHPQQGGVVQRLFRLRGESLALACLEVFDARRVQP